MKKLSVIGAGFAGLSAAAYLAQAGFEVNVFDKNSMPGGRAQEFKYEGFTFDMGPSWYWMPDTFEKFFSDFGYNSSDFYTLKRLDPSYQIFFDDGDCLKVPANRKELDKIFEQYEPGSSKNLNKYLHDAKYKYNTGMREFVEKPSLSIFEFMDFRILSSALKLHMFSSVSKEIKRLFSNPKLIQLLEFPVLFLGARPEDTPALYSLMNYADICLGTWYPTGGMHEIAKAMETVAKKQGAKIHYNAEVEQIDITGRKATGITLKAGSIASDAVLATADYHHVEQHLLSEEYRQYKPSYWDSRVLAPSSLIFYVGLDKKMDTLLHHNLFFDANFDVHAREIYKSKEWPGNPLFYVCCPSRTDRAVAPDGHENLFILIPIAPGIKDEQEIRSFYFDLVLNRIKVRTGVDIKNNIVYKRSFCIKDFEKEYHSFKGNAYGLANTLLQTAFLKPKLKSKVIENLYFAGQLTTPGPGVPPSIISGRVASRTIIQDIRNN